MQCLIGDGRSVVVGGRILRMESRRIAFIFLFIYFLPVVGLT